ncbi:flagellar hook assembly protein FlgD [Candidatus Odyssella thessalonicensis]|uniref:flagellar hook assembly protein FlgD n=1 Tax=Candidatus Odyssella thessalonicensis TaxID=84647 RepID=UPI000225AECF|nr:flagellar hook capping FlgD N-terminal domain-containing protein [Candidatus Odyssella thessalonicensis]
MVTPVNTSIMPPPPVKAEQNKEAKGAAQEEIKDRSALTRMLEKNRDEQYNVFMKMFLAQVKNQNPDDPMSTHEMTQTVMSFFSAAEQAQTNKLLKQSNDMRLKEQMAAAKSYLNKEILYESKVIKFEGNAEEIQLIMPPGVKEAELQIYDADSTLIKTVPLATQPGSKTITWSGNSDINPDGIVPTGLYRTTVKAIDDKGEKIEIATALKGTVRQITYDEDGEFLLLVKDDLGVEFEDVLRVRKPASQELLGLSQTMRDQIKHYEELNQLLKSQLPLESATELASIPSYLS